LASQFGELLPAMSALRKLGYSPGGGTCVFYSMGVAPTATKLMV
jgi:hypothetical protein